ncbi:MAG: F0F1 ATP synthase subunit B [Gammaproteobacteria bacterium]|jgi:F-type H+-transporting ATPase subunit b|nr:F0F1 ATP synthase subunit B [Gammaproteobacteria bacterium]
MNINLTLIGQAISFAIFVWFCVKYVWPPVLKALEERETRIADGLAAAEKGQRDLENAGQRVEEILAEGRDKAQEFITQSTKRADEIVEEAKSTAVEEGERLLVAARSRIDQERNEARESLRNEVAVLALSGAEQVLMREVDANVHRDVLDKLTAEI